MPKNISVVFEDGNVGVFASQNILKGEVKNRNHRNIYGVGFIGYGKYNKTTNLKAYTVWKDMLNRCYSDDNELKFPTYVGCTVSEEWKNFQNFCVWFSKNYIVNFQIDKDLLFQNNKLYSDKTCCFLPRELNTALQTKQLNNENYPVGIRKIYNKFHVRLKTKKLVTGSFYEIEKAILFYKTEKEKHIKQLTKDYLHLLPKETINALEKWEFAQ